MASRCGQPGAFRCLPYVLDPQVLGRRSPRLVLLLRPERAESSGLCASDIEGAALFFEYELLGKRTGIITSGDAVGFSSVVAPWGDRARTAALAARALMHLGAHSLVSTFDGASDPQVAMILADVSGTFIAERQRRVKRLLPLCSTLEETLATMGKSTRANLRRYRRRAQAQLQCELVREATVLLTAADLVRLNAGSLNPTTEEEAKRRFRAASTLPGAFMCGLRSGDGRWLSVLGGWRHDQTTVLHWQVNSAGFEKLSLGTVARSHFLENEIRLGQNILMCYGGTPHPMRHAFEAEVISDLVLRRKGLKGFAVRQLSLILDGPTRRAGKGNFFLETFASRELSWIATGTRGLSQSASLFKPQQTQTIG